MSFTISIYIYMHEWDKILQSKTKKTLSTNYICIFINIEISNYIKVINVTYIY